MNAKKIFKTILGVGTLVGTAYVAYRTCYQNGKDAKLSEKSETDEFDGTDEDDDSDSDDTDEDSDFLNDAEEIPCQPEPEVSDTSEETSRFKHFSKVDIGNVYIGDLIYAVEVISKKNYIFNKTLRDCLFIESDEADKILTILENAGYISKKDNHSGRKVYVNWEDYKELYG